MNMENNIKKSHLLFEEVWNKGNLSLLENIISETFILHLAESEIKGIENYKKYISSYLNAFPDVHFTIEDIIKDNGKLVERYSATGTQTGSLLGIPPTNKYVKITGIDIVRFENEKMVERWGQADLLGLIRQLKIIPMLDNIKM